MHFGLGIWAPNRWALGSIGTIPSGNPETWDSSRWHGDSGHLRWCPSWKVRISTNPAVSTMWTLLASWWMFLGLLLSFSRFSGDQWSVDPGNFHVYNGLILTYPNYIEIIWGGCNNGENQHHYFQNRIFKSTFTRNPRFVLHCLGMDPSSWFETLLSWFLPRPLDVPGS